MDRLQVINSLVLQSEILQEDYPLWSAWSTCVASAICLEVLFDKEVALAKKQIWTHLEGRENWTEVTKEAALQWCSQTYDVYHPLRNNVETLDNIEEIRGFLKKHNLDIQNVVTNIKK
jgi:hypothetical protein